MAGLQHQLGQALAHCNPPETRRGTPTWCQANCFWTAYVSPAEEQSLQAGGQQNAGANGLPEEGVGGGQSQQTAGMSSGASSLPAEGIAQANLNRLQGCVLVLVACLQKAVLCWQTHACKCVFCWHRGSSRLAYGQERFQDLSTVASQSVANWALRLLAWHAHWCWSSLPEEGNGFLSPSLDLQLSHCQKKSCRVEVGWTISQIWKNCLIFPWRKKSTIFHIWFFQFIFYHCTKMWWFFTFEILIHCGVFFSIQRCLEGNLFLTKQQIDSNDLPMDLQSQKKNPEFSMGVFPHVFSSFQRVKSSWKVPIWTFEIWTLNVFLS